MFIDLNAPDNSMSEEERRMVRLWQSVIIQAIKTACESAQKAYESYIWNQHKYGKLVCEFAMIDHDLISECFYRLQADDKYRRQLSESIYGYKSATKGSLTRSTNYIQTELFA